MTNMTTNLEPAELFVLCKIDNKKDRAKARSQIEPGDHEIDLVVRVRGTLGVGEDYLQTVSPAVPWRDLFLAALSQMTESHRAMFVRDFMTHSDDGPAQVNRDALAEEVETLAEQIVGTTERMCSGKTRANLVIDALQATVVEQEEVTA